MVEFVAIGFKPSWRLLGFSVVVISFRPPRDHDTVHPSSNKRATHGHFQNL